MDCSWSSENTNVSGKGLYIRSLLVLVYFVNDFIYILFKRKCKCMAYLLLLSLAEKSDRLDVMKFIKLI